MVINLIERLKYHLPMFSDPRVLERAGELPSLNPRPDIHLMSPRRFRLLMNEPIDVSNITRIQHSMLLPQGSIVLDETSRPLGVDWSIYYEMRHMNAFGPQLPCHALRQRSKTELGSCKKCEEKKKKGETLTGG